MAGGGVSSKWLATQQKSNRMEGTGWSRRQRNTCWWR